MSLINSITLRDNLYKRMKLTNPNSLEYEIMCINLKTYSSILKKSIRASKLHYFLSMFAKYKSDIGNTWKTINEIISRKNKKFSPNISI